MTEGHRGETPDVAAGVPDAVVETGSGFSLVWVIPLVAALVAAFLTWNAISERGPTITISFVSAEGLEAGKTRVKFKDVVIGSVKSIEIAKDMLHVLVTAELVSGSERFLNEGTRFWVVRPQLTAGRITGVGTLLSGAYVELDPEPAGPRSDHFLGLESPPVIRFGEKGTGFTLRSKSLTSVDLGAPVYYRRTRVGKVTSLEIDASGDFATTGIFVRAPHDARVRANTRFWDASGIDLSIDAEGIQIHTPSIVSLLIGGIAFDAAPGEVPGEPAPKGTSFALYKSHEAAQTRSYEMKQKYVIHFEDSVQGLKPGSAVVFRGIRIGEVMSVALTLDWNDSEVLVPVLIEIEPERIEWVDSEPPDDSLRMAALVERGLRAKLGHANLLTGRLQVELDLHPDAPLAHITLGGEYPELPTVQTTLGGITSNVVGMLAKIEALPFEEIGRNLNESLIELRMAFENANALMVRLNVEVMPSLASTMSGVERAVGGVDALLSSDSPAPRELQRALREFGDAAHSVRMLVDYLERHPEALLRGKRGN